MIGLGLWNWPAATIAIEVALFVAGVWIYTRTTRPADGIGTYGCWSFVTLLALLYLTNTFGVPPPNTTVLAYFALAVWLVVPWAWWFDRHRLASFSERRGSFKSRKQSQNQAGHK